MAIPTAAPHRDQTAIDAGDVATTLLDRARALSTVLSLVATNSHQVAEAAAIIVKALATGHLVMVCGNGGSAAEAQHLAGELVGRFRREREPWPVLALTTDSAVLTAIANDYGYDTVFARQVDAFGHRGDVLVAISTSGESPNVVNAAIRPAIAASPLSLSPAANQPGLVFSQTWPLLFPPLRPLSSRRSTRSWFI